MGKAYAEKTGSHTDVDKVCVETYLGVPTESGMVLSSDTAGNRVWVTAGGGGAPEAIDGGTPED